MRILHVIPFLWSGAGNVLTRLCEAQACENEVIIVTSGRSKGFTDWPEYRRRLSQAGVDHLAIDFFDRDPAVFWRGVEAFHKLACERQPDVIHCHSGVPACAAALSGRRFIAQLHSWGVGRPEWMNTMDLEGFRRADRILCASIAYQKILIDGGVDPGRIRYLPWGIDLSNLARAKACDYRSDRNRPRFRIGFLGRIEARKCQLELARAFHAFHRKYPHSMLEFVGPVADKAYGNDIGHFVSANGLEKVVKVRGRMTDPFPRVKSWNLFSSLSSDEGQGMAALEAMALGVPVLARQAAGLEDFLLDGRTGISVRSSGAADVSERIEWALHHPSELAEIARGARALVEREYNLDRALEKMKHLYETFTGTDKRLD